MPALTRLAAAMLCALAAASAVHAQTRGRVQSVPNTIPSTASRIAQTAPRPTGLMPTFPAGITSGSGAAVSTNPIAQSTTTIPPTGSSLTTTTLIPSELPPADSPTTTANGVLVPGTSIVTPGTTIVNPTITTPTTTAAIATNVMGAGAGATVRGPGQTASGAAGWSATDQARFFFFADANHDGELSRAEFSRLGNATMTFEEMDRNYDGVISRFEYEDSQR